MSDIIKGETLDSKLQRRDRARLRSAAIWGYELSKDPARRLGAILVHSDDRQSSLGYNGLATGIPDNKENWERPLKYELVIHAEMNALDNRSFPAIGGTLFCLIKPCHICLNRLANNKLSRIVWLKTNVDFKENQEKIWWMIANNFLSHGGLLVEYEKEDIDYQLEIMYEAEHKGYDVNKIEYEKIIVCSECHSSNINKYGTQPVQTSSVYICSNCGCWTQGV